MKQIKTSILSLAVLFISCSLFNACNNAGETEVSDADSTEKSADTGNGVAEARLAGTYPDTTVSGTARFTQNGSMVKLTLNLSVPAKAGSTVAVHIHEHGDCGDAGNHAGGHWNPTGEDHGKWGSAPFHSGDIGNLELDAEGNGSLELESDRWSIGGDERTNVLGKTIVIHSGVDDYTSQPSGNSGNRIGCAVIEKQ